MTEVSIEAKQLANEQQLIEWNGEMGDRWVASQEFLDGLLAPFSDTLINAACLSPGERVLDIGCGCGATTLDAARRVGHSGMALGLDISEPMLGRAEERARKSGSPARFSKADASRSAPDGATFDVLISRFGVMFFDEPAAAFANLRLWLRPGGRIIFVCWRVPQENVWMSLPLEAARSSLPVMPAPDLEAPGPFAFARRERIESIMMQAELDRVTITPFDTMLCLGTGETTAEATTNALERVVQIGPLCANFTRKSRRGTGQGDAQGPRGACGSCWSWRRYPTRRDLDRMRQPPLITHWLRAAGDERWERASGPICDVPAIDYTYLQERLRRQSARFRWRHSGDIGQKARKPPTRASL